MYLASGIFLNQLPIVQYNMAIEHLLTDLKTKSVLLHEFLGDNFETIEDYLRLEKVDERIRSTNSRISFYKWYQPGEYVSRISVPKHNLLYKYDLMGETRSTKSDVTKVLQNIGFEIGSKEECDCIVGILKIGLKALGFNYTSNKNIPIEDFIKDYLHMGVLIKECFEEDIANVYFAENILLSEAPYENDEEAVVLPGNLERYLRELVRRS